MKNQTDGLNTMLSFELEEWLEGATEGRTTQRLIVVNICSKQF
jgi:hypothetical protein